MGDGLAPRHRSQVKVFRHSELFDCVYIKQNQFSSTGRLILHEEDWRREKKSEEKWNRNNNKSKSKNNNTNRRNSFTHPQFVWLLLMPLFSLSGACTMYMYIHGYLRIFRQSEMKKIVYSGAWRAGIIRLIMTLSLTFVCRRQACLPRHVNNWMRKREGFLSSLPSWRWTSYILVSVQWKALIIQKGVFRAVCKALEWKQDESPTSSVLPRTKALSAVYRRTFHTPLAIIANKQTLSSSWSRVANVPWTESVNRYTPVTFARNIWHYGNLHRDLPHFLPSFARINT